jgi:cysteine-rich repeat protein
MRRIFTSLFFLLAGMVCIVSGYTAEAALGTCGNDVVEKFEQCDDGNLSNVDACSSLCQKEGEEFLDICRPCPCATIREWGLLCRWRVHHRRYSTPFHRGQRPTRVDVNIRPNIQRSGFDSRIQAGRYDPNLRIYPPINLTPGNKLVSSRSAEDLNLPCVMRPYDTSGSPVASISIPPSWFDTHSTRSRS